jgi:hypothetical protein
LTLIVALSALADPPQLGRFPQVPSRSPRDPRATRMEREHLKRLNKERYEKLRNDTDKLLELATELKQEVDRADEGTLSLEVIRKAEEVEKLAKNVGERMKEDIGPAFR